MPLRITFELSDKDLRHFRRIMRQARAKARDVEEREIIAAAGKLLQHVREADVPEYVHDQLMNLAPMIGMIEDTEWQLTGVDRARVLSALAYFVEPTDLIPDHTPGFGFLDDAIMVELLVRELQPEIEAYADFRRHRKAYERRQVKGSPMTRGRWLADKREQLQARMRRRRMRMRQEGLSRRGAGVRSPFSLW